MVFIQPDKPEDLNRI